MTSVDLPLASEENESAWFLYYQDQFDAHMGSVASPSDQYPQVASRAYERAKVDWNQKVLSAKRRTDIGYVALGVVDVIVIYALVKAVLNSLTSSRQANDD